MIKPRITGAQASDSTIKSGSIKVETGVRSNIPTFAQKEVETGVKVETEVRPNIPTFEKNAKRMGS